LSVEFVLVVVAVAAAVAVVVVVVVVVVVMMIMTTTMTMMIKIMMSRAIITVITFLSLAGQPLVGQGLFIIEVSQSHSDTHHIR
jgi:hypothetical protein